MSVKYVKWTADVVDAALSLRHQGFTNAQIARKLSAQFAVSLSPTAVKRKLTRLGQQGIPTQKRHFDDDGVQSSTAIVDVVKGHDLTPDDLMKAHGYDPTQWQLISSTSNFWKQKPTITSYQTKISVKPLAAVSADEIADVLNAKVQPVIITPDKVGDRNLVIPLYDLHFGIMTMASMQDTLDGILRILQGGYKHTVIELGGDLLHSDYITKTMTANGTQLDHADMVQAWKDAKAFVGAVIEAALHVSQHVSVQAIGGNHDYDMQWAFTDGLADRYPQVSVHNDAVYRRAYRIGHVGIMMAHGDTALKKLPMLFATEFSDIWATSQWRETHYGHYHHEIVNDDSGVITRQLGTPKNADNYEKKNGYVMSRRTLKVFEYDDAQLRVTYDVG